MGVVHMKFFSWFGVHNAKKRILAPVTIINKKLENLNERIDFECKTNDLLIEQYHHKIMELEAENQMLLNAQHHNRIVIDKLAQIIPEGVI